MSTTQRQYEREHTVDEEYHDDEHLLANLDERSENVAQMEEVAARTVEPGVMNLVVNTVTTAENSPQFAIDVEHPVGDKSRFYFPKPREQGWHDEQPLVKLLRWHGIYDKDPYKLQLKEVFLEHVGDEEDVNEDSSFVAQDGNWRLKEPPWIDSGPTLRERATARLHSARESVRTFQPSRTDATMYAFLLAGVMIYPLFASVIPDTLLWFGETVLETAGRLLIFTAMTVIGLIILDP